MPKVYIVQDETPNAFATGRNPQHAAVAVTTGILRILDRNELKGVIAHELSHVYHRDTLISSIAATIAGAIAMLANMAQWGMILGRSESNQQEGSSNLVGGIVMMIVAPIAATLIQMAVSRSREYDADAKGAKLSGEPLALASALQKLETLNQQMPMEEAEARPATAHLFIVNPLSGRSMLRLFSTHPSTEDRVRRLREMASRVTRL
jgi:heat shock protein HtpX